MECLILVAEKNGPTMMARIGIMKALNRHVERVFNPDRKDKHWGKRNLKRDEQRLRSVSSPHNFFVRLKKFLIRRLRWAQNCSFPNI
jgi:hypothetical protein